MGQILRNKTVGQVQLLLNLDKTVRRQGPGGETKRAIDFAGIKRNEPVKIADMALAL